MILYNFVFIFLISDLLHLPGIASDDVPAGCRLACDHDSDCSSGSHYYNPCTFCEHGTCRPMCGVYCNTDSDCRTGGVGNLCTYCSQKNTCVNPRPLCGSFCGGDDNACIPFGNETCPSQEPENCCKCSSNWTEGCISSGGSTCGAICTSSSQCYATGHKECPTCSGYHCSVEQQCGQNCISSGQCQSNPGSCISCIGTICSNCFQCGGMCGGDDQCCPSGLGNCPVCGYAKCESSSEWEKQKKKKLEIGGQEALDLFLKEAENERKKVRENDVQVMKLKLIDQGIYQKEIHDDIFKEYVA